VPFLHGFTHFLELQRVDHHLHDGFVVLVHQRCTRTSAGHKQRITGHTHTGIFACLLAERLATEIVAVDFVFVQNRSEVVLLEGFALLLVAAEEGEALGEGRAFEQLIKHRHSAEQEVQEEHTADEDQTHGHGRVVAI